MTLQPGGWAAQGTSWTDDRVAALKHHAAAGLSASRIAAEMGVTRNAVIGKLSRMGAQLKGTKKPPPQPVRVMKPQPARVKIRPGANTSTSKEVERLEATEIIDLPPDTSAFACTIADLGADMCRYPLSEPTAEMRYCGAPARGSWCARHHRIVWNPVTRRR